MWAKLSNALKHRPTIDEAEPPSTDQCGSVVRWLSRSDSATLALMDAMRPSIESTRPETLMDGGYGSLRSILRDRNTPATGQSVRFFSRDAYRIMTPEGSAMSEQGNSPNPENPRLNDTYSQAQLSPSGSRHHHCVCVSPRFVPACAQYLLSIDITPYCPAAAKFCGDDHEATAKPWATRYRRQAHESGDPCSQGITTCDSPTENGAEFATVDPDLPSQSFHSQFWPPLTSIIES
ncbi:hypothetical protein BC827DRAFT_1159336 [Russula dissimulans]|nr:hypothetical protein BC827DRAFT_1159336 [Russula dissimulans]